MAFGSVNVPGADDKDLQSVRSAAQAAIAAAESAMTSLSEHKAANNPHGITVESIGAAGANHSHSLSSLGAAAASHSHSFESLSGKAFHVGTTAPSNKGLLWIDTTANTGGLKYHNGSAWVHVPVAYT